MIQVTSSPADARILFLSGHWSSFYTPFKEPNKVKLEKNRCDVFDNPQKDFIAAIDKQMWPFVWFCWKKKPRIFYLLFNVCNLSGFFLIL